MGYLTSLQANWPKNCGSILWQGQEICLFFTTCRPALASTLLPVQWPCPCTFWPLKLMTITLSWNTGHQSPSDIMPHSRRMDTSTMPLRTPNDLQEWVSLCRVLSSFLRQLIEQGDVLNFQPVGMFSFLTGPSLFDFGVWFWIISLLGFYAICHLRSVLCFLCITLWINTVDTWWCDEFVC